MPMRKRAGKARFRFKQQRRLAATHRPEGGPPTDGYPPATHRPGGGPPTDGCPTATLRPEGGPPTGVVGAAPRRDTRTRTCGAKQRHRETAFSDADEETGRESPVPVQTAAAPRHDLSARGRASYRWLPYRDPSARGRASYGSCRSGAPPRPIAPENLLTRAGSSTPLPWKR